MTMRNRSVKRSKIGPNPSGESYSSSAGFIEKDKLAKTKPMTLAIPLEAKFPKVGTLLLFGVQLFVKFMPDAT